MRAGFAILVICLPALMPLRAGAQTAENGLILHYSARAPGKDLSGRHNHGEWHDIGAGPGIPGISARSLAFDGSGSYIRVPPSAALDTCKSITVALWFNALAFNSSTSRLFLVERLFGDNNTYMHLAVFFDAVLFAQTDGKATQWVHFPEFLKKNSWYHLTGVFDHEKREMRIYLNGTLRRKMTSNITPAVSPERPLYIGAQNFNAQVSHLYEGYLEDLRLYNRALNDGEVRVLTKDFTFSKPETAFEPVDRLEAGRYLLSRVDTSGQYRGVREIVEVSAAEPLWKRGWFVALSLAGTFLFTFLLAFFFNRYRQQELSFEFEKARLLERERFRIAREMHDDIGTGLSAINLLTEIALNKSKDPQLAGEIERIAATARDVHGRIQDIIWAISAQNDTLEGLAQHLRRVATELLAPTGAVIHWNAPEIRAPVDIRGDRRRALFLAFKEALHNIVRHAYATRVDVELIFQGDHLSLRLHDNGRGFNPAAAGDRGNGLVNMQRRMEDAGGTFSIASGTDGTVTVFEMPV